MKRKRERREEKGNNNKKEGMRIEEIEEETEHTIRIYANGYIADPPLDNQLLYNTDTHKHHIAYI